MQFVTFKKIAKKFSFKKRSEFRAIGEKADHDWRYILLTFFFLTIASLGAGFYIFVKISNGEIFTIADTGGTVQQTINQKELDNAITFFEERRKHFLELQNNPLLLDDPSL